VKTDIVMPAVSGTELDTKVRAIDAYLPVLFMSGYCDRFDESKNGFQCLSKTFDRAELIEMIPALSRSARETIHTCAQTRT